MATFRALSVAAVALAATLAFSTNAAVGNDSLTEDTLTSATPTQAANISLVSVNGSGCSAGSVRLSTSGNESINVMYSDYQVWSGHNSSLTEARKNCALGLQVAAPQGWTFAVRGLRYDGFAQLDNGASGVQRSEYYVQGMTSGHAAEHQFSGPYTGSVSKSDSISYENLVWAPCDSPRNININTELRVDAGTSHSTNVMAMDSTSVPGTNMQLAWKQC